MRTNIGKDCAGRGEVAPDEEAPSNVKLWHGSVRQFLGSCGPNLFYTCVYKIFFRINLVHFFFFFFLVELFFETVGVDGIDYGEWCLMSLPTRGRSFRKTIPTAKGSVRGVRGRWPVASTNRTFSTSSFKVP